MSAPDDVAADVAHETVAAVIGDLQQTRAVIRGWTPPQRLAVADKLEALAGELADLAHALRR